MLGLQQIAIGSTDRSALNTLWLDILGLNVKARHRIESENVEEDILELGSPPNQVEVDLMTPIDANASPRVHSPPLNHVGVCIETSSYG